MLCMLCREYEKAGELIERGLRQGEGWVEAASAQAALCMLHGKLEA